MKISHVILISLIAGAAAHGGHGHGGSGSSCDGSSSCTGECNFRHLQKFVVMLCASHAFLAIHIHYILTTIRTILL